MTEEEMEEKLKKFQDHLDNMTPEQEKEMEEFFKDDTPKGWVSIEDHLPMMLAKDIMEFSSEYKVKYKDGSEGTSRVSDHNIWYYHAKDEGITHWFNM